MTCPFCGKNLLEHVKACTYCGRELTVPQQDGKWGVIGTKGNFLIEPRFDDLQ